MSSRTISNLTRRRQQANREPSTKLVIRIVYVTERIVARLRFNPTERVSRGFRMRTRKDGSSLSGERCLNRAEVNSDRSIVLIMTTTTTTTTTKRLEKVQSKSRNVKDSLLPFFELFREALSPSTYNRSIDRTKERSVVSLTHTDSILLASTLGVFESNPIPDRDTPRTNADNCILQKEQEQQQQQQQQQHRLGRSYNDRKS
uniref:Uncharacterized protein n=1 Tax=Vespula pensylvanica TaxID=30213 RepID=A0A834JH52_VESPE|nr:hypothetical protein H0235_018303 [Vespula pensylvanica]